MEFAPKLTIRYDSRV